MPKFDIVIGNPPYQTQSDKQQNIKGNNSAQATPIYNKFIEKIKEELDPKYLAFIIPSRWFAGGIGLDKFRKKMQTIMGLKLIKDFFNSKTVFKEVEIVGGVCYFLSERGYSGSCKFISDNDNIWKNNLSKYDIVIRDEVVKNILDKILNHNNFFGLDKKVLPRKPFNLPTNFNNFAKKETGIKCYGRFRKLENIQKNKFTDKHNILNKWKVMAGKADGTKYRDAPNNIFVAKPNEISTETYLILNTFNTEKETDNFVKYAKTHFFEFMLRIRAITQDFNKNKYSYVPDQLDYTVEYTDKFLYKKYGFTQKEINFIENKFK